MRLPTIPRFLKKVSVFLYTPVYHIYYLIFGDLIQHMFEIFNTTFMFEFKQGIELECSQLKHISAGVEKGLNHFNIRSFCCG